MEQQLRPKLSVVIPVFNEKETIGELLYSVQSIPINKEIIIVDDGSHDGTQEFLQSVVEATNRKQKVLPVCQGQYDLRVDNIRIFMQERNCGKGAALRRGFQEARGEIVIVQDADLEYDPSDYHMLIKPIEEGRADVVYGSRFSGGPHRVLYFWHYVGNKFLTLLSDMTTNLNLSDVWTCYKAFRWEVLQAIRLREDRFGFEPEVTAQIAKMGYRVYEVPISYWGRTYEEGKKITWKDGIRAIYCIIRYKIFG